MIPLFSKFGATTLGLLMFATGAAVGAPAEEYELGVHYQQLPLPVDTRDPGKVEVVEVFSYGCVHCFNFEPALETWRQAQGPEVAFRRLPAIFSDDWKYLAQVFYAAEALGVTDKVHMPIFEAMHLRKTDLRDPETLAALFSEHAGVHSEELVKVLNSFAVRSRVQQADGYGRMYRVSGVPSLVVNGKYLVDGKMAGNNTRMLQVVDYLVQRERQAAAGEGSEGAGSERREATSSKAKPAPEASPGSGTAKGAGT